MSETAGLEGGPTTRPARSWAFAAAVAATCFWFATAAGAQSVFPDPNDFDQDGVANAIDNCLVVANPAQLDSDGNGKGDACDAQCPNPTVEALSRMGEDARMEVLASLDPGPMPGLNVKLFGTPYLHDVDEARAWIQDRRANGGVLSGPLVGGLLGTLFDLPDWQDEEATTAFMQQFWHGKRFLTGPRRGLAFDRLICEAPLATVYHEVSYRNTSEFDGKPIIHLAIGPPFRDCWDEVRTVESGVYLGINFCPKSDGELVHLQTFVLDADCPDPPPGTLLPRCEN